MHAACACPAAPAPRALRALRTSLLRASETLARPSVMRTSIVDPMLPCGSGSGRHQVQACMLARSHLGEQPGPALLC